MLRISEIPEGTSATCLRLEGQVIGLWVAELRRVCAEARGRQGRPGRLVLDLTAVSFVDADARRLFGELASAGVEFINGSAFVAEQLKGIVHVES